MSGVNLFTLLGTIAVNGTQEAKNDIDQVSNQAEKSENKMTSAFKKIGAAVVTYLAVDKVVEFGKSIVETSASVSAEQSAFSQIMGNYSNTAQEKLNKIADATGMLNTRLTPYMTSMTAKFKGLGFNIDESTNLASVGLNIAADASAFWDKSLTDSMGALNSFVNGNYEGGEAIGLFANETTLAAYASKSLGLQWKELTEMDKQYARLEFARAMQVASGATGQAAKESGQYANVQGNLNEAWRQFQSEIGNPILQNVVLPAMKELNSFITGKLKPGFENLVQKIKDTNKYLQENEKTIKSVTISIASLASGFLAFKAVATIIGIIQAFQKAQVTLALYSATTNGATIAQGFFNGTLTLGETLVGLFTGKVILAELATSAWAKAQILLNAVMSINPIGLIIGLIVALVAAFIMLWKNSESFRNFWIGLWETIKNAVRFAIDYIKELWSKLINWFSINIIEPLKKYFTDLSISITQTWSNIKKFFIDLWTSILQGATSFIDGIKSVIGTIATWINDNVIQPIYNLFMTWIWPIYATVFEMIVKIIEIFGVLVIAFYNYVIMPIVNFFIELYNKIIEIIQGTINFIRTILLTVANWIYTNVIQPIINAITSFFNWITGIIQAIWDFIVSVFSIVANWINTNVIQPVINLFVELATKIKNVALDIWNSIKSIFSSVGSWFSSKFQEAYNAVTSVFSSIGNFFGGLWNSIKNTFSALGTSIGSAISGAVKSGINGVIGAIEGTINTGVNLINGAINLVNKIPGVSVGKIGRLALPRLKNGGVLNDETAFIGGEYSGARKNPEIVTPQNIMRDTFKSVMEDYASRNNDSSMSDRIYELLMEYLPMLTQLKVVMSTGELVGILADPMDKELAKKAKGRSRGR